MRRNIISIVRGGPAPEEQLSVLKKTGWDGGFFTWTGQKTDHVFAPKIQAAGLALQSVHAPYDRATRGGLTPHTAKTAEHKTALPFLAEGEGLSSPP